ITPWKLRPLPPLFSGLPCRIRFCTFLDSFSNGVPRSKPNAVAAMRSVRCKNVEPDPGPSAPSNSGLLQSTMTFAGSKSYFDPSPWHSGQAPYGELKLNERGSSCGTEI